MKTADNPLGFVEGEERFEQKAARLPSRRRVNWQRLRLTLFALGAGFIGFLWGFVIAVHWMLNISYAKAIVALLHSLDDRFHY